MLKASGTTAGQILSRSNPTVQTWPTSQPQDPLPAILVLSETSLFSCVLMASSPRPHLRPSASRRAWEPYLSSHPYLFCLCVVPLPAPSPYVILLSESCLWWKACHLSFPIYKLCTA